MAYSIVNHEQSMRLFAAKSAWDMKMSVVVAGFLMIGMSFFNLMMGILGRALFPTRESLPVVESLQQTADAVYPVLVRDFTSTGFKGIVVAGLVLIALVVSVLTWRYWLATRPIPIEAEGRPVAAG